MNMMLCLVDSAEHIGEEGVTIGEDFRLVMSKRKHHILLRKELHYLSVFIGHMEVVLLNKLEHGALCELVNTSLTHESLLPCIHPKEEIEHHTCYRHKIDNHHPGHGL